MQRFRVLGGLLAATVMVVACGGGGGNSGGSSDSCSKTYKVGLVTDVGKLNDKSFNANSYKGVTDAEADKALCVKGKAIESSVEDDYPKNIKTFVDQKYDMIVTVGFKLGDATIKAAKENPSVKFVMVDFADFDDKVTPANLLGLLFQEDQAGFMAGAIAGLATRTGTVAGVYGLDIPPVHKYRVGFEAGAKYTNPSVKTLGIYQPESGAKSFNDPDFGKQNALTFFSKGADVVFGAGGNTGNGALLAAHENKKMCIGVDVDQYESYPDVRDCLITSAEKHLALAVKTAVANGAKGSFSNGILNFDAKNNGVGFSPFHNFSSQLSANGSKLDTIFKGLADGTIQTGYKP